VLFTLYIQNAGKLVIGHLIWYELSVRSSLMITCLTVYDVSLELYMDINYVIQKNIVLLALFPHLMHMIAALIFQLQVHPLQVMENCLIAIKHMTSHPYVGHCLLISYLATISK